MAKYNKKEFRHSLEAAVDAISYKLEKLLSNGELDEYEWSAIMHAACNRVTAHYRANCHPHPRKYAEQVKQVERKLFYTPSIIADGAKRKYTNRSYPTA